MFKLTREELNEIVMSQNVISPNENYFSGQSGGSRKLPCAFTEQGIYMLMTVLKGEIAIKQSISIIRLFKVMKDYIQENTQFLSIAKINKLENKVEQNRTEIKQIKDNLKAIMDNFIDPTKHKHYLLFNGERIESDIAYQEIYKLAKNSVIVVDDYINIKTLQLLKACDSSITISIYSDNKSKDKITDELLNDFVLDSGINITIKPNNDIFHDRYIFIDHLTDNFKVFHCGTSSKDAGNKIHTIVEINEKEPYMTLLNEMI